MWFPFSQSLCLTLVLLWRDLIGDVFCRGLDREVCPFPSVRIRRLSSFYDTLHQKSKIYQDVNVCVFQYFFSLSSNCSIHHNLFPSALRHRWKRILSSASKETALSFTVFLINEPIWRLLPVSISFSVASVCLSVYMYVSEHSQRLTFFLLLLLVFVTLLCLWIGSSVSPGRQRKSLWRAVGSEMLQTTLRLFLLIADLSPPQSQHLLCLSSSFCTSRPLWSRVRGIERDKGNTDIGEKGCFAVLSFFEGFKPQKNQGQDKVDLRV